MTPESKRELLKEVRYWLVFFFAVYGFIGFVVNQLYFLLGGARW
jgi:hypothetical protein